MRGKGGSAAWGRATGFREAKRIVVKVGSSTLTNARGGLDVARIRRLAEQLARLRERGCELLLVSSGAIAAGTGRLGLTSRPRGIPEKQAVAALGQGLLMHIYEQQLGAWGILVGQVLLTREDLTERHRHLNARATLSNLLRMNVMPVINENDTVATDEIRFGDNDTLSALVSGLVSADLLVILSDVEGVYPHDPRLHPDGALLEEIDESLGPDSRLVEAAGGKAGSLQGTGGMATKISAARVAARSGVAVVIAHGHRPGVLEGVVSGGVVGTLFHPERDPLGGRKRWIAFYRQPKGRVWVDAGAADALVRHGTSLLPSGVRRVSGSFSPGDLVAVWDDRSGAELARGLANYGSLDLARISGVHTARIESLLGFKYADEVIHRDNLVLLARHEEGTGR